MANQTKSQKIELIPWDPTSSEHFGRVYQQRLACGWREDEVESWKDLSIKGTKLLYWVVLGEGLTNRDDLLSKHLSRYPEESSPLRDTGTRAWGLDRTPSGRSFVPVGHLAVQLRPEEDKRTGLWDHISSSAAAAVPVWICHLYISWPLQSAGLGRQVMAETERLMTEPPLNATCVVLDTMAAAQQLDPVWISCVYSSRGIPSPKMSNQEWYEKQGYAVYSREDGGYNWRNPQTGNIMPLSVVYLMKNI